MPPLPKAPEQSGADEPVKISVKKGFDVIATRNGFYKGQRLSEGDKFSILGMEEAGDWMQAVDKSIHKQMEAFLLQEKKRKTSAND